MQQLLIPGQFAQQALFRWDWSSTSRQEVGANDDAVIWFGRFCVLPRARQLLVDGQPVELGSRAFDLLMVLIGAPGALVTKNELLSRVWPDTVVEEGNLKVQMSAVRKVLNEDREVIKTVHGRGYVFTGEVTTASAEPAAFARLGWDPAPASPGPARQTSSSAGSSPRRQLGTASRMTEADREPQSVVVVIDDDPDIRAALRGLLRAVGLRVQVFASVQEFLDSALPDLPGCLILDVRLPGRSGLDFQEEIAKASLCLPIIFISGHADVPMSVRAMKAGAIEFLTKPVRDQDLLDAIQLAVAKDRARRDDERDYGIASRAPDQNSRRSRFSLRLPDRAFMG
jgi:FixJ family two-component response regulator/DNA-binding winged helix-turn-helix (wHTH) protein